MACCMVTIQVSALMVTSLGACPCVWTHTFAMTLNASMYSAGSHVPTELAAVIQGLVSRGNLGASEAASVTAAFSARGVKTCEDLFNADRGTFYHRHLQSITGNNGTMGLCK